MVGLDVGGDGGGEEIGAGVALVEAVAEDGGGDVFVEGEEEVDAGLLGGGEGEGFEGGWSFEGEAGAADYDPLGQFEEAVGLAPAAEGEEAVGADDDEEGGVGELLLEGGEGVDGVVGGAVGMGGVDGGRGEAGVCA